MKNKLEKSIAFSKYTPSVFFVMSPFQLLCAIEAIRDFCISEYKMVFVCLEDFEKRNNQMKLMAKDMGVVYDYYSLGHFSFDSLISNIDRYSINEDKKYSRIFIGDYYVTELLELSVKYASEKAILVYMDDGNSSISLLQGIRRDNRPSRWSNFLHWYKNEYKKKKVAREILCRKLYDRGIICSNCFYTIYSDLKSRKFILYPNEFNLGWLQFDNVKVEKDVIYIVGPAIEVYAKQNRIRIVDVESIMWSKLSEIRSIYENKEIIYIPHGRDTNEFVAEFCKMLNIKYKRIDETIEYYMAKHSANPCVVCGINSTALLNIKRMFPETTVVNWFLDKKFDNSFYSFFRSVANYYEKNGIVVDVIKYPCRTFKEWLKSVYGNLYGFACLFLKK